MGLFGRAQVAAGKAGMLPINGAGLRLLHGSLKFSVTRELAQLGCDVAPEAFAHPVVVGRKLAFVRIFFEIKGLSA